MKKNIVVLIVIAVVAFAGWFVFSSSEAPRPEAPPPEPQPQYLDSVIDSAIADLDTTIAASYDGTGQVWKNLIASPADGAAQGDYDFNLGKDGKVGDDDPAFTNGRFVFDGNDFLSIRRANGDFSIANAAKANTDFINGLSKKLDGRQWWAAIAFSTGPTALDNNSDEVDLFNTFNGSEKGKHYGVILILKNLNNRQFLRLVQINDASMHSILLYQKRGRVVRPNTDYLLLVTYDADSAVIKAWMTQNGRAEHDFPYAEGDKMPESPLTLAGKVLEARDPNYFENGWALRSFALGNVFLDEQAARNLFSYYEDRHGKRYTP